VEEVIWLFTNSHKPLKNGKLNISMDFKKLNATTYKDPYLFFFTDKVINIVVGHELYTF
jgi:hypothetical protein